MRTEDRLPACLGSRASSPAATNRTVPPEESGERVQRLIGPQDGNYKVTIAYGDGVTVAAASKIPVFPQTMSSGFPARIGGGDDVLFGEPKLGEAQEDDLHSYARGFLLRVKQMAP